MNSRKRELKQTNKKTTQNKGNYWRNNSGKISKTSDHEFPDWKSPSNQHNEWKQTNTEAHDHDNSEYLKSKKLVREGGMVIADRSRSPNDLSSASRNQITVERLCFWPRLSLNRQTVSEMQRWNKDMFRNAWL